MTKLTPYIKKILFALTAILAGLSLFVTEASFDINHSILTSSFHKGLFFKYDIYSRAHSGINSSITDFIENLKKSNPDNYQQHKDIFSLLERSITYNMVAQNLDSLRDGLIQYFEGEKKILPDIHLDADPQDSKEVSAQTPVQALASVDRVNLSAILLSIDRNDITEEFSLIRVVYYMFNHLTQISLFFFLLLLTAGILLTGSTNGTLKWLRSSLFAGVSLWFASGAGVLIYAYFILPRNIYPIAMSLPLPSEVIISYIRDCLLHVTLFLLISGFAATLLLIALKQLYPFSAKLQDVLTSNNFSKLPFKPYPWIFAFLSLVALVFNLYNGYDFKKGFESQDFQQVISHMFNASAVTKIIPATEDNIYDLEISITDKKTGKPIPSIQLGVSGKSVVNEQYISKTSSTDTAGKATFSVDEGSFRVNLLPGRFPSYYQLPPAFYLDIKTAGTTVLQISLDPVEQEKPKPGFIEIEVLDKDNKPVPGLELQISGDGSAPGNPDMLYSSTNADGIAVFKVNPGNFKISFTESKLPKKYLPQPAFDAVVSSDNTIRYTLRLAEAK